MYSQLLRDSMLEIALLYDCDDERSWLVPKLSLLLHMCHVYMTIREAADPIPFVTNHRNAGAVVNTLEDHGDLALYGTGDDVFRLRTLLQGIHVNLLSRLEYTQKASTRKLYGYELMDIVTESGRELA